MKKQNFKKILSILLVTVMLSSMVIMSIPASADSTAPLISETLAGNTVNDIAESTTQLAGCSILRRGGRLNVGIRCADHCEKKC